MARPVAAWHVRARDRMRAGRGGAAGCETPDRCGEANPAEGPDPAREAAAYPASVSAPVRVFLVADVSLHRAGLVALLQGDTRVDVVGSAPSVEQSLADVASLEPDVCLLDVNPADRTEGVAALTAAHRGVRVVVCAVPETEEHVIPCAEAGAAACLPSETPFAELVATIRHVASGESVASPRVTAMLMKRLAALATERAHDRARQLTAREREILQLIDDGLSNKDIAARLHIEVPTVKNHVHNILEKLQVRRRYEAAAHVRNGNGHARPVPAN